MESARHLRNERSNCRAFWWHVTVQIWIALIGWSKILTNQKEGTSLSTSLLFPRPLTSRHPTISRHTYYLNAWKSLIYGFYWNRVVISVRIMDKDYAKVQTLIFRAWATCGWSKGLYFKINWWDAHFLTNRWFLPFFRALEDIKESISELQFYKQTIFK